MQNLTSYLLTVTVGLLLSACGGDSGPTSTGDSFPIPDRDAPNSATDPINKDPNEGGNFLNQVSEVVQRIQRNLSADQIPALTDPVFVDVNSSDANYIKEDDLVLGLFIGGEAKAYPHNIGWLHEITNDTIGGKAVVVSFCPLTGTGMVFDGEDGSGGRLTCGVSGNLFNNNLVMYDRRDNLNGATLYPQMMGLGVTGARTGNTLSLLPVVETTWRYWKTLYPDTKVVGSNQPANVGNPRQYNGSAYQRYPYGGYRDPQSEPFFNTWPSLRNNPTRQLYNNKDGMLGVRFGELAKAYPFRAMDAETVINDTVGGNEIDIVHHAAEQLAIPYFREFNGQLLSFEKVGSLNTALFPFMMRDSQSETTWDLLGRGVDGPNTGQQLTQVPAHNAFWFAWATFWQNTGVL